MKAILLRDLGGPELLRLEDVADPTPGPGEAVIRLKAAALNHRDVWIRKGQYAGIKLPAILGSDGAGIVERVGEGVDASLVGREVVVNPSLDWGTDERFFGPNFRILGLPDAGTYAQFVKVPAENVHARPAGLSWNEAAAIPLAGLTAYRALVSRAKAQAGETVFIPGIGSGVATFALLFAKKLGARVLVTSGNEAKLERARALGADGGACYKDAGWVDKIRELSDGQGPDVVIDGVGGETYAACIDLLRPGGRIATFGATTGPVPDFLTRQVFWKQLNLLGTTMGSPAEFAAMLDLFADGSLRPVVDRAFPLAEASAAHQHMDEAGQFGKIVLEIP
ncbi:zinc-binding dehydrogenase [Planctomyces sp. SH-PL62]|uniref:zinc-binding dehydrogenase n=1 Tax=Planctomyces sp. SH-PL62 TaxID=1636152 RepID=UPI00078C57DF|nr:zinc-binding dehydrogenase [Planctomyces sp. SH-PL62]AMV40386.1 Crotonyl-CoA reductase [Planctomyces sp. SH-PL62]